MTPTHPPGCAHCDIIAEQEKPFEYWEPDYDADPHENN